MPTATVRRTALFVDFDNVYIGLRRLDEQAAELEQLQRYIVG